MKPRVFIASSVESIDVAFAIQENLRYFAECTVWNQGVFDLNEASIETLIKTLSRFEYGIFVFKPDDIAKIRRKTVTVTRDNVVFELGLFCGRHGKERNFIIAPTGTKLHMPTDLLGMTPAFFDPPHSEENLIAALGPACNQITRAIKKSPHFAHISEGAEKEKVAKQWSDSFINVPDSRKFTVKGKWVGDFITRNRSHLRPAPEHPIPPKITVEFEFKPGPLLITATSSFKSPNDHRGQVLNDYVGGFCSHDCFRLDYRKHNPSETGFGAMLFEISADSLKLYVHTVGFSSHIAQTFFAEALLHKVPELGSKNARSSKQARNVV